MSWTVAEGEASVRGRAVRGPGSVTLLSAGPRRSGGTCGHPGGVLGCSHHDGSLGLLLAGGGRRRILPQ